MTARTGKVYVYCINCEHNRRNECLSPNNMNINHWLKPEPSERAQAINKNNDCKWFEKPKWYAALGWGTSP